MHGIVKRFISQIRVGSDKALTTLGVQLREDWKSRVLIQNSVVASPQAFRIRVLLMWRLPHSHRRRR